MFDGKQRSDALKQVQVDLTQKIFTRFIAEAFELHIFLAGHWRVSQ